MTITLNINITGLDKLADAIMALAQFQSAGGQIVGQSKAQSTDALPAVTPAVSQPVASEPVVPATPITQTAVPVTPPQTAAQVSQMAAPQATAPMPQPAPVQPAPVQTTQQSYTLDDLATAAMTLMDSGRMTDLQTLLASFGVDALPALPQSQYGAFATALRGMGARI